MIEATLTLQIQIEQEEDGRWIAEVPELPGVMTYGGTTEEAKARVQALALRVLADRLEHGEGSSEPLHIQFHAPLNAGGVSGQDASYPRF